eukprot:11667957-Prorocentrum_lima.AAC.1
MGRTRRSTAGELGWHLRRMSAVCLARSRRLDAMTCTFCPVVTERGDQDYHQIRDQVSALAAETFANHPKVPKT